MSTSILSIPRERVNWLVRLLDYFELIKPKIAALILLTSAVSGFVAGWGQPDLALLLHALFGTLLIAGSASALNHYIERHPDALMDRTSQRPLPAGRLSVKEVLLFGAITGLVGLVYLSLSVGWVPAFFGALTWVLYVAVYTPLKSRTSFNTFFGAIAGAMPVFISWTAVGGQFDLRAFTLFTIVFLWQFPHFMAIAWIYRRQYAEAGMKMLTVVDPSGRRAGVQAVLAALALLPVSLVPAFTSPTGAEYILAAFLLSAGQLACAILFFSKLNEKSARRLLHASLIYLPSLFVMLMLIPLF